MEKNKGYVGIDYFRVIVAFLIVAIHTSPFASFSETGDFIFTRIIARVAVPFFFMTSGFFVISRYARNTKKLGAFVKRTAAIYGAAILLYIPVNIYNGYFRMDNLLPNMIKDLVFDGTLYHLWYLPASMTGAVIAWYLVKSLHYPKAMIAASVLYFIGLFGDSYYGIAKRTACINSFYDNLFQVTDYTRNGIFFAPIFFIIGGFIADKSHFQIALAKNILGFVVSFAMMSGEALVLYHFDLQRHDSMYVFLLPCMYFLFHILLHFKGKRLAALRTASLLIYIIHPLMIVLIRLIARQFRLQEIFVENSIVHYVSVCFTSAMVSWGFTMLWKKYKPQKARYTADDERAYLEIDLNNLEHNAAVLQKALPPKCELMAVVKAQAYGHGAYEIATHLERTGVNAFAVATIDEGIELRRYGVLGEVLVLGYTVPSRAKELHKYKLTQTLIDYEYADLLNRQGYLIKAHIKVDTGMHRLGFGETEIGSIIWVLAMHHIQVCGIFTHLCVADSLEDKDASFTKMQIDSFNKLLNLLKERGIVFPKVHMQSSYGLLNYPELKCDYMRAGVALYGVLSSPDDKINLQLDLRPVLSLKARVILVRKIKKGDSVGYGRSFVADRDSMIAVLPIGYADGYPRKLSCKRGYVLINGQRADVVGRICMDQLTVDVTDIPDVKTGMTATLIGKDGDEEILASMVAKRAESITNELLSRMGRRLNVFVINKK